MKTHQTTKNPTLNKTNLKSLSSESIKILCLGAGRQVGRSCVVVQLKDKRIMFDTGIHMLYSDQRRYPNFASLFNESKQTINDTVDLVLITHFHLDHCGALPYLTQKYQYTGPIYASTPTKAMIPYMLQDFRKVTSDVKKQQNQFYTYTVDQVKNASKKINSLGLQQSVTIAGGIKITSYYAGHVLGACMFNVQYDGLSVMYTGDYNSYADRHLGAAYAPRLCPNVVITETTYATTIRDTKRDRERKMLRIVTETVEKGGKVLIPVFALGRAQELSVLLETYWNRTDNKIPIYFSAGLIQKANFYYQLFVDWQNEKIKEEFQNGQSVFEFKKVKPFDKSLIRADTPYVLFATPGMLHGGTSMQVFKEWCNDERNTIIIPGYCVQGTIGNKLLKGVKTLDIDKKRYQVNMRVQNISFSAHADAKGIITLLRHLNTQNVVFVHGDGNKMDTFAQIVQQQIQKKVYMPENHKMIQIPVTGKTEIKTSTQQVCYPKGFLIKQQSLPHHQQPPSPPQIDNLYRMIRENQLLKQVNEMNKLMSIGVQDPGLIVSSIINCEICLSTNQLMLMSNNNRYKNFLTNDCQQLETIKKHGQQKKQQQQIKNLKKQSSIDMMMNNQFKEKTQQKIQQQFVVVGVGDNNKIMLQQHQHYQQNENKKKLIKRNNNKTRSITKTTTDMLLKMKEQQQELQQGQQQDDNNQKEGEQKIYKIQGTIEEILDKMIK